MCIRQASVKKFITLLLLCLVLNVACDFSAFTFTPWRSSTSNVDLDHSYLESFLEVLFHKNIHLGSKASSHNQSSTNLMSKLCSELAFHQQPLIYLPVAESAGGASFMPFLNAFHAEGFMEINSPPPKG